VFGLLLGLALLKFGNPIVLDRRVEAPREMWEFIFQPWPLRWGYVLLSACALLGLTTSRVLPRVPRWSFLLPVAWFSWQMLCKPASIDSRLSDVTVFHFAACLGCFFLGLCCLSASRSLLPFWAGILIPFLFVLWMGFEQHYGGLEETRKMFFAQPDWQQYPAEYIKRIRSNRIFSTLVYPNALAAAIILLLPALLLATWQLTSRLTAITRGVLAGALAYCSLACLVWTSSKAGWLVGLAVVFVLVLRRPLPRKVRIALMAGVILLGLGAFFVKFAPYFQRGAPSVSARFEYWRAAARTAVAHPVFGTGPGTFSAAFRVIKPPEAEMAQLVHNDYLEQASDSGLVGCVTYIGFIVGSMLALARKPQIWTNEELFLAWLGLLGWSLQSFVEFLLYIPALAWPAFTFFGLLWARSSKSTS
jgi:hypothetical protein